MPVTLLRERTPGRGARVTYVELFFDLVFVFAVTQLSHALLEHLSWTGAAQAGLMLMAVWWAWVFTSWITNWLEPEHPLVRLMLFVLMALGLVLSTSLPQAFEGRGLAFALAYATFQLGRTFFMLWAIRRDAALRRNFQRVAVWLLASATIWVAGGLADGETRLVLWALALAIEYLSVAVGFWVPGLGRTLTEDWTVEGAHLAERCALFVIICLGESVLVTGATFAGLPWAGPTVAAFVAAFLGAVAIWWIYFSAHASLAAEAIAQSPDPGRIGRTAYTYVHILVVAGIILTAAGDELALTHPEAAVGLATGLVLLGGPATFLLGAALFKLSVFGVWSFTRFIGLALLAALAAISPRLNLLTLSAAATAVLAFVGLWETLIRDQLRADVDRVAARRAARA